MINFISHSKTRAKEDRYRQCQIPEDTDAGVREYNRIHDSKMRTKQIGVCVYSFIGTIVCLAAGNFI